MHRVFGVKENAEYRDREGAYIIPVRGDKVGVVRTPKGYFLVGGGIEDGESHTDCLVRECREETGYTVAVGERLCTAETYLFHSSIGYFHPIQTYYLGEFIAQETAPTESDHEFMWVRYDDIKGKMFFEMQDWALKKALEKRCGSGIISANMNRSDSMIREADRSELPVCADVIRRSFMTVADEFGFTPENAPLFVAFAMTAEKLTDQLDNQHRLMYVYICDDKIIGFFSLLMRSESECELGSLSVLPEYRHRGIGEELVRQAADSARSAGCTLMKLSIVEENTVLRRWYERLGAVHTGTEKFDFFPFTCGYMEIAL